MSLAPKSSASSWPIVELTFCFFFDEAIAQSILSLQNFSRCLLVGVLLNDDALFSQIHQLTFV
jgi:hypothetical protein